jgi:hypothetical protein
VTATNTGDVRCSPEITITGYAEAIECSNQTTGQTFRIIRRLQVGDILRIDTDSRTFGVWLNDVNTFSAIDPISEWWALEPGPNILLFRGNTATGTEPLGGFTIRWSPIYQTT